jgi:acyl-CoA synthetase (NDP forming)
VIITGAGGSGVLLSDSCVDAGQSLMSFPHDVDEAFKKFIPPFGASGIPVEITGGEPPLTYQNTIRLGLEDDRIHAVVLGYWHTIVTPPMVFAKLVSEVVEECRARGIDKPVIASRRRRRGRGRQRISLRSWRSRLSLQPPKRPLPCSEPSTVGPEEQG